MNDDISFIKEMFAMETGLAAINVRPSPMTYLSFEVEASDCNTYAVTIGEEFEVKMWFKGFKAKYPRPEKKKK